MVPHKLFACDVMAERWLTPTPYVEFVPTKKFISGFHGSPVTVYGMASAKYTCKTKEKRQFPTFFIAKRSLDSKK
jgi:hypothetical protein